MMRSAVCAAVPCVAPASRKGRRKPITEIDAWAPLGLLHTSKMLLVGLLALAAFTGPRLTALRRFVVDVPHRGVEGNVTRMRPFTLRTGDFADHARVGVPRYGGRLDAWLKLADAPPEEQHGAVVLANLAGSSRGAADAAMAAQRRGAVAVVLRQPTAQEDVARSRSNVFTLARPPCPGCVVRIPVVVVTVAAHSAMRVVADKKRRAAKAHLMWDAPVSGRTTSIGSDRVALTEWSMWSWSFVTHKLDSGAAFVPQLRAQGEAVGETEESSVSVPPEALHMLRTLSAGLATVAHFTPRFVVLPGTQWRCNNAGVDCGSQCTNRGRYCSLGLTWIGAKNKKWEPVSAAAIVRENLRQLCILQLSNSTRAWFDYVERYSVMCGSSEHGFLRDGEWGNSCSANALRDYTPDATAPTPRHIAECVRGSGGADAADGPNTMLQREASDFALARQQSGIRPDGVHRLEPPSLFINGWLYHGPLLCETPLSPLTCRLLAALCSAVIPLHSHDKNHPLLECTEAYWSDTAVLNREMMRLAVKMKHAREREKQRLAGQRRAAARLKDLRAQENIKWWAALIASAAVSLAILNNVFRRVRQNQIMVSSDDSDSEAELFA